MQYCGEYTDQESGFIYLRNRYYDSETGRFINEDPARSGGNWYSYCSGNPIMFWDKAGLSRTMSKSEKAEIKKYQEQYNKAKENNDYVGMNKAHLTATNIRKTCDPNYKDNYDYTHGGKIYNYTYTYEEYEQIFNDESGQYVKKVGNVYILNISGTDEEKASIADAQSIGTNDVVVIDYRNNNNPNMQIRNSTKITDKNAQKAIIGVLLEYNLKHSSNWKRTEASMVSEWVWHNRANAFSKGAESIGKTNDWVNRIQHVDLDNEGENLFPKGKLPEFSYYM